MHLVKPRSGENLPYHSTNHSLLGDASLAWCGRLSLLSNCLLSICCLSTASQCSSVVEPSWPLLMVDDSSVLVDSAIGTAASSTLAGDDSGAIASLRGIGRCGLPACSAAAFFFTSKIGLGSSCWCRLMYRLYGCLLLALLSAQVAAVALTLLSQSFHAATKVVGRRSRMTRGMTTARIAVLVVSCRCLRCTDEMVRL